MLAAAALLAMHVPATYAQSAGSGPSFLGRTISGSVGFSSQAYGASGIPSRRPGSSFQAFARTTFDLFGLSSGFNLTYSTTGTGVRQSLNRISFATAWGWGRVRAGTVSPTFSTYSLNGETLRGGLLEVSPGPVVATFAMGRAQRAVQPRPFTSNVTPGATPLDRRRAYLRGAAYERWLYAARLGVGSKDGTHVHLIGLLGRDSPGSIASPAPGTPDSLRADSLLQPAENLSVTPSFGLQLFEGALNVRAEATASAYTRDVRDERLDLSNSRVPSALTRLFTPRTSSRFTVAGRASAELSLRRWGMRVAYNRVQPGFRSMGRPQEQGDREIISVRPRVRLLDSRLNVSGQFQRMRNNLLDQKITTLRRRQYMLNAQMRLSRSFTLSSAVMQMVNENTPTGASGSGLGAQVPLGRLLARRIVVRTLSLTPTLSLRGGQRSHTFTLSAALQSVADESPPVPGQTTHRPDADTNSLNATLSYVLSMPSGLAANASANFSTNGAASAETQVTGFNVGASYAFLDQALRTNATVGLSQTQNILQPIGTIRNPTCDLASTSRQFTTMVTATYRLWDGGQVSFNLRGLSSQSSDGPSFQEVQTSLRFAHRF